MCLHRDQTELEREFDDLEALLRGMHARLRERERWMTRAVSAAPPAPLLCQVQSCPLF
jgi:hypothetical protein